MQKIEMKKIEGFVVTFILMKHLKSFGEFVNAYVYLEKIDYRL